MTDAEVAAGYLSGYLAGGGEVAGNPVGWAGKQLHALVVKRLGDDPALRELAGQAGTGPVTVTSAAVRRMAFALAAATEVDPAFGRELAVRREVCEAVNDSEHPRYLGAGHPFNQDARNALARFLGVTGHPVAATAAFEALLCDCVRHLGPEHPVVRGSGVALFLSGEVSPVAAAGALKAVLADCLRALGPGHEVTRQADRVFTGWYLRTLRA